MKTLLLVLLYAGVAFGADKTPKELPQDMQNRVLKAQIANQKAVAHMSDLQAKWQSLQNQMQQLQAEGAAASKELADTNAAVNAAVADAAKNIGIDLALYDFDYAKLVFNPKPSPAPATPSPVKK